MASTAALAHAASDKPNAKSGRLKQGVTNGVFGRSQMSMDERCRIAADVGCTGCEHEAGAFWDLMHGSV